MRRLQLLVLLAGSLCLAGTVASAQPIGPKPEELTTVKGFQFSISAPQGEYGGGLPIEIGAHIKNVTDKELSLGLFPALQTYQVEVTTEKGEPVPLTRYGQILYGPRTYSNGMGPLDIGAGVDYKYPIPLTRICDMTAPGTYLVKVKRTIRLANDKEVAQVTSNVLRITIR